MPTDAVEAQLTPIHRTASRDGPPLSASLIAEPVDETTASAGREAGDA